VTQLTGKMLLKGTRTRTAEQIATQIEAVGGNIDSYGGNNSFGVNAEVMSSDFGLGLDLVSDVILNPSFPAEAFERERGVQLAGIRAQKDQLLQSAAKSMRRALFQGRGYGLDAMGDEESVQKLTADALKQFHDRFARPNNCVLAIFGDIQPQEVKSAVEKAFGGWKQVDAAQLKLTAVPVLSAPLRLTETRDKKQAVLVMGFRGTTLKDAGRYPLELLQESCSDLGSRLFLRIREQLGLAYYVGAQNFVGLAPGYFAFYVGTAPEKAELVEKELLKEAELLRSEGLTEEELKRSKAKVVGQKKISRQDLGSLAMMTALDELYGLGYAHADTEDAFYEAVTLEQVKAVAQKYLLPDSVVIAIVKPPG
jgi:zinc protease